MGGLQLNVTAILTIEQIKQVSQALSHETPSVVSVFAGRIADTGRDPMPIMKKRLTIMKSNKKAELYGEHKGITESCAGRVMRMPYYYNN